MEESKEKTLETTRVELPKVETAQQKGDKLLKKTDKYKQKLAEINDVEELQKEEKKHLKAWDKYDKEIKEKTYMLPEYVKYRDTKYSRNQVIEKIIYFMNKISVSYNEVDPWLETIEYWLSCGDTVQYIPFENMLRILGEQTKYSGRTELIDVQVIKEFLKEPVEEYSKDITDAYYIATLHNHVMDRLQLVQPVQATEKACDAEPTEEAQA